MGLDTSHGCWNGPYSAFMRWRTELHHLLNPNAGPLHSYGSEANGWQEVDNFHLYDDQSVPINILMRHSDCDGEIEAKNCSPIADALQELLDKVPARALYDKIRPATERFISGLREASENNEPVEFY